MTVCVVKLLHMATLLFFTVSVYKVCVQSETATENNALTVVPGQELEDDGVEIEVEPSEIEYDPNLVFYPTKEWQTVQNNQAIPAGLHVRLNMETGTKEAKLMEGDDGMKYWQQGQKQGMLNPKSKSFTRDELKEALKDFKEEAEDEETTRRREASIKKKFKKYEDLKKDMESMNLNIKTDGEIITTMVEKLKLKETEEKDKLTLLVNLEYYLHQIDNAVMFCDMGGMSPLSRLLNHTANEIRAAAAHVMGSATQSNPAVQVEAMESGALPQLIRLLSTDKHQSVRRKTLYAISSIVRHFPIAQQKLLQLGGLTVLIDLFKESGTEKLQEKTVTLLSDLLLEQEHINEMDPEDASVKMRKTQYKEVPLLEMMLDLGWCDLIPNLLHSTDHDVREKVITAMFSLRQTCSTNFSKSVLLLKKLQGEYSELSREEVVEDNSEDLYFTGILEKINSITFQITLKEEL